MSGIAVSPQKYVKMPEIGSFLHFIPRCETSTLPSPRAFHEKHPNIFLELEEYGSARACDLIQDERLDVALVNMEMHNIDKFYNLVLYRE